MTGRTLAVDYPVATPQADFVIKAPAEWTNVQCTLVGDNLIVLVSGNGLFDTKGNAKDASFDVVVTPKEPYFLESPAPPAPVASGASAELELSYTGGTSYVKTFGFRKPEGTPKIHLYLVPVVLKSIGFDNTIGDIVSDDRTVPYISPQWQDGNHDGTVLSGPGTADGDLNYPVGFVRNTKPELTDKTVVKLGGPLPAGVTLYLTAESNPNGVKVDDAELQADGSYLATLVDAPVESTEVLHDSINYYDAGSSAPGRIFQVDWKVRLGGGNFLALAETRHTLYKTAAMPLPGAFGLRESMVYYACYGARGADPASPVAIADTIQVRVFETKNMKKVPACLAPYDIEDIAGNPLKYESLPLGAPSTYLPQEGSDVCNGWAILMRDTFKIHGIQGAVVVEITPNELLSRDGMPLDAWLVPVQKFTDGTNTPPDTSLVIKGQGSGAYGGLGEWQNHALTALNATGGSIVRLYDPSYGLPANSVAPYTSLLDYENKSVAGFRYGSRFWKNLPDPELVFKP